jgi:flavin reductase (DIM6/NTAB) family NADH-FMN oxidoreductase RutF
MPESNMISMRPSDMPAREAYLLTVSTITPRPIAWVSTISAEGVTNLAPFSFFNAVSGSPPTVMFSVGQREGVAKDTLRNVDETGEFVVNLVDEAHAQAMNLTAGNWEYGQSEFEAAELEAIPSIDVKPPRVAGVPVALEAKVTQLVPVKDSASVMVLGQIVRFHVREDLLLGGGLVDNAKMKLITRLGGAGYMKTGEVFEMQRPTIQQSGR